MMFKDNRWVNCSSCLIVKTTEETGVSRSKIIKVPYGLDWTTSVLS